MSAPSNPTEEISSERRHVDIAHQYARDVVAGKILACKWVKLACQRQLDDLQRIGDPEWPYVFDETRAARVCRFLEQLPHIEGEWAERKEKIRLEPWQCFSYSTVFGWVHRDDPARRRFRIGYIAIPRKNAKSTLGAGTGLYMLAADGEHGAQVYAGATTKRQAGKVFLPAKSMVERTPRLREAFGIRVGAKRLVVLRTGGLFEPVTRNPGDGDGPSCAVVDEYHEHPTDRLVDTMRTGMGARKRPLLWIITTAGFNIGGPCHQMQSDVQKILEGTLRQETTFGIIYTIDEGDDWTTEEALIKANPNYGVSVFPEFLQSEQAAAVTSARKQNVFLTKNLNVWVGAATAWMNSEIWKKQANAQLDPNEFLGLPAYAAADLSSKLDITARALVFVKRIENAHHYYAFSRFYLPAERANDPELLQYRAWVQEGFLKTTPGNVIDYDTITADTIADVEKYRVRQFGFDPWNAEQFAQKIAAATPAEIVEIPQQVRTLSEPMKQLEALVIDGRLHHDGNPVMSWMMSNVVAHLDAKDNIYPRKEKPELKIDGPVALIMALSRALAGGTGTPYTPTEVICV